MQSRVWSLAFAGDLGKGSYCGKGGGKRGEIVRAELLTPCTGNGLNNMGTSSSKQRVAPTAIFPVLSVLEYISSHQAYAILFFATDF